MRPDELLRTSYDIVVSVPAYRGRLAVPTVTAQEPGWSTAVATAPLPTAATTATTATALASLGSPSLNCYPSDAAFPRTLLFNE